MKRYDWNYIQRFHLNPPKINEVPLRCPDILQSYNQYICNKQSLEQELVDSIFNTPEKIIQGWQILRNNYPYFLEENIDHLVLWIHPDKSLQQEEIEKIVNNFLSGKYVRWIYYQNLPEVRSVKITHYHVFAEKF